MFIWTEAMKELIKNLNMPIIDFGRIRLVNGINSFKDYFKDYSDKYVIIGGCACDLLSGEAGVDFRITKDIDMVLIVEALNSDFVKKF